MCVCFAAFLLGFLSILQFGEVALEWSVARYQRTIFPYDDNILHKSYQDRLCLPLPIDVVYTWVNGTDPLLLKDLAKLKSEMEDRLNESSTGIINSNMQPTESSPVSIKGRADATKKPKFEGCPYANCVPLNSLILKLNSKAQLAHLKAVDPVFQHAWKVTNVSVKTSSRMGAKKSSITIVKFDSERPLKLALNRAFNINGDRVVTQRAYLTSQSVELAVRMRAVAIVSLKKSKNINDGSAFKQFLHLHFSEKLKELEYYEKEKVAVLTFKTDQGYNDAIGLRKGEVRFHSFPLLFEPAMMVWEPFSGNAESEDYDNHFSASRFADNQELRYSLRSVEKHAPWVRKIFIVTNGQIPFWLNLENPRIKIVTHSEIFTNKSHLPTFSSPAIESHLHKIPGLSKKFIYLNDDVMFGTEVWPDDFFTHAKGQKIFLSWPVPNCNEGCPSTWINDKYCDKACNVSDCDWDGGDCIGSKSKQQRWKSVITNLKSIKLHDFCNSGCADSWIGDRYCDSACNNPACGLDAGDCGVQSFSQLHSVTLHEDTKVVYLPNGLHAVFFNLTEVYGQGKITEGEQDGSSILRSVTIAQKFKVMTITFYPNQTMTTVSLRLAGLKTVNDTKKLEIKFNLTIETKMLKHEIAKKDSNSLDAVSATAAKDLKQVPTTLYPIRIYNTSDTLNYWNAEVEGLPTWKAVDQMEYCVPKIPDDMTVPNDVVEKIAELEKDFKSGDITDKGYRRKQAKLLRERLGIACNSDFHPTTIQSEMRYMKSMTENIGHLQKTITEANQVEQTLQSVKHFSTRHLNNVNGANTEWSFLPWERHGTFKELQELKEKQMLEESYKTVRFPQRSLLDAFSGSLLHVNRIYNRAFGYKPRKVPSHMPHMIDVDIMKELQARFPNEFDKTSSHKLRSPEDMQFALSYFYYVIDQTKAFNVSQVFEEVDVDKSGTLSDRELRTLLTRFNKLPLDTKTIGKFLNTLKNCSGSARGKQTGTRSKAEQQHGYDLPVITGELLRNCEPILKQLNDSKKKENKFKHEIVGEEDIAFKMIKNNASRVLQQLDEIRKNKKKFICLNDNIDHEKENSSEVKSVLVDFYESLFPTPSQFELPNNLRNRFLTMDELKAWKSEERQLEFLSDGMLVVMVVAVFFCVFWHQLLHIIRRVVIFFARRIRTPTLSTTSSTKLLTV